MMLLYKLMSVHVCKDLPTYIYMYIYLYVFLYMLIVNCVTKQSLQGKQIPLKSLPWLTTSFFFLLLCLTSQPYWPLLSTPSFSSHSSHFCEVFSAISSIVLFECSFSSHYLNVRLYQGSAFVTQLFLFHPFPLTKLTWSQDLIYHGTYKPMTSKFLFLA